MTDTNKDQKIKTAEGGDTKSEPKKSRIAELLFLDDDDDFEEFPVEDWGANEAKDDEKATAWSENWDVDELDDEFSKKLRSELEKLKSQKGAPAPQAKGPVPMTH